HAVLAGVIMMVIMAGILFFALLPKIGKFVPSQSIAGFLFVLGAFATVPASAGVAFAADGNPAVGAVTMAVTAVSDPFFGMLAGIALKVIMSFGGVV
ncbi:MAG: NCS2 family permease, partial [Clostridia bacterium]